MKTGNKHLFDILEEILEHSAINVKLKENGKINLFFDGCCECDIKVQNYIDLRCDNPTEKGGEE